MATLADMKTRISTELVRDDLGTGGSLVSTMVTLIGRACEYYADQKFWFNSIVTTANTAASTVAMTIPSTVRVIDKLTIPAYDVVLTEATLSDLSDYSTTGRPTHYAYYNDTVRFYPIPDAIYTCGIFGIAKVAAPTLDADTSIWTNEAQDLIIGHTKVALCRMFKDELGIQLALAEERDALARLRRETAKRLQTKLVNRDLAPYYYTVNPDI